MDALTVSTCAWRSQEAWRIAARSLEIVVTRIGAQLASIRLPGDQVNPLWQPPWPAAKPDEALAQPGFYGSVEEARLLAVIVGHNLCVDRFGAPWPGEDKPIHGEAGILTWTLEQPQPGTVRLTAILPLAKVKVVRILSISGDTLTVRSEVSSTDGASHAIEFAEHPTMGDPFLDGVQISAGVDRAWNWPGKPDSTWRFQAAGAEGLVDPVAALVMPPADQAECCGDVMTSRVVDGFWTAVNPRLRRTLTYRWNRDEYPWLAIWTEHRSRGQRPWNGITRSRGLEFSTKPFPEGKPPAERATTWQDRPCTCLVPAQGLLVKTFTVTWTAG